MRRADSIRLNESCGLPPRDRRRPQNGARARTRRERWRMRGAQAMTDPTDLTRRTSLTIGSFGAFGGALVLAGCTADASDGSASPTASPSPSPSPSPTLTAEPEPGATAAPDAPAVGEDVA